jgi:hypothetical protein
VALVLFTAFWTVSRRKSFETRVSSSGGLAGNRPGGIESVCGLGKPAIVAHASLRHLSRPTCWRAIAGDQEKALKLVQQSGRVMEAEVVKTGGDCAYGGPRQRAFSEEQRTLTAKAPACHH